MRKRTFEIVLSTMGIMLFLPLLIVVAFAIWLFDRQNPLFLHDRLGIGKRPFVIIKYRSMKNGVVTPLGRVIRRTGIDELPQLLNVLAGTMSLVGPRPLTRADVVRLGWDQERYAVRWTMKPGIVGLAQLSDACSAKVSWLFDRSYVRDRTLWMDIKILTASTLIIVVGKVPIQRWVHRRNR